MVHSISRYLQRCGVGWIVSPPEFMSSKNLRMWKQKSLPIISLLWLTGTWSCACLFSLIHARALLSGRCWLLEQAQSQQGFMSPLPGACFPELWVLPPWLVMTLHTGAARYLQAVDIRNGVPSVFRIPGGTCERIPEMLVYIDGRN